jgi:tetratricopeptide (TPR) repeat protein
MSLLIKALHKAEQGNASEEKLSTTVAAEPLELAPMEPDLEAEAGFSNAEPAQRPARDSANGKAKQRAAGTVFSAKSAKRTDSTTLLIAGGAFLLVLVTGGFDLYLESLRQPELVIPKQMGETVARQTPVVVTAMEEDEPVNEIAYEAQEQAESIEQSAVTESAPTNEGLSLAEANGAPDNLQRPTSLSQDVMESTSPSSSRPSPSRELKVTVNDPVPAIHPDLERGYQAFQAGDDAAAQSAYRRVLQTDVRNIDALLGMAAVAMRQGRGNDAIGWYEKVLEIEPRNSFALAAMADLLAQVDPVTSESRIKNLIALQPAAAHLHAALGGIYVERNDWLQAQQAYFEAYRLDSSSPEHAFNLAVSLDQLGKGGLALQYYLKTLDLLGSEGAGSIDHATLESRITQLRQSNSN